MRNVTQFFMFIYIIINDYNYKLLRAYAKYYFNIIKK